MMSNLHQALSVAVKKAYALTPAFEVFPTTHADYATNVAFQCSALLSIAPMTCAKVIVACLEDLQYLQQVDCVEPGFINFIYEKSYWTQALTNWLASPMPIIKTYDYPYPVHDLKQQRQQAIYRCVGQLKVCGEVHVKGDLNLLSNAQKQFYFLHTPVQQDVLLDVAFILEPSMDNPWYLLQYAYQRNAKVLSHLFDMTDENVDITCMVWRGLTFVLLKAVLDYQDIVPLAIQKNKVYLLLNHLKNLARTIHCYYNEVTLLNQCHIRRAANMMLLQASQKVLAHGLILLGVDIS
jgi:arginyl-tRNA synthetase